MIERYFSDHWTLEDQLGIAGTGDLVARMCLEVKPPFSIRVTGKWGSGKTSILRRAFVTLGGRPVEQAVALAQDNIKEQGSELWEKWVYNNKGRNPALNWPQEVLDTANKTLGIWYSPWQHQGVDNPLVPLLLEIQAQFSKRIKFKKGLTGVTRRGALAAMALLERVTDAAVSLEFQKGAKLVQGTTEAVKKAWQEGGGPNPAGLTNGQRFHLLFEDAVRNALISLPKTNRKGLNQARMIVFIDDLDRCEESVIVDLLESIKLYLESPHCVFVLGLDDAAVLRALKRHWEERSNDDNREYLEKMFQSTVSVPLPGTIRIRQAVKGQLEAHGFPPNHAKCAKAIEQLIEPNPRKIKNFCNSLVASWDLLGGHDKRHGDHALRFILFHYLRMFHGPVWRILEHQPKALPVLHRVLTGSPDPIPSLPGFDEEDQRILKELFSRAFLHVLKDDGRGRDDDHFYHRNMGLDQAVASFRQRLDRKRSDEFFVYKFGQIIDPNDSLDQEFLYLPDRNSTSDAQTLANGEGL